VRENLIIEKLYVFNRRQILSDGEIMEYERARHAQRTEKREINTELC
jgi:hypothetical protein